MTEREECPVHDLRGQPSLLRIMGYEAIPTRIDAVRAWVWRRDMMVSPGGFWLWTWAVAAAGWGACLLSQWVGRLVP